MAQQPNKVIGAIAGAAAFGSGLIAFWQYHQKVRSKHRHSRRSSSRSVGHIGRFYPLLHPQTLREVTDLRQEVARLKAGPSGPQCIVQVFRTVFRLRHSPQVLTSINDC